MRRAPRWVLGPIAAAAALILADGAAAQTQSMLNKNATYEFARAALDLQQAVDDRRRQMSLAQRRSFEQAQRYWVKYRESARRFETSGANGAAQTLAETNCRTEMTREWLGALRRLADCAETEVDCLLRR